MDVLVLKVLLQHKGTTEKSKEHKPGIPLLPTYCQIQ